MKKVLSLLLVLSLVGSFGTCLAAEESIIPIQAELGSITITEGWNLIAMPVLPSKPYSVRQFIEAIERPVEIVVPKDKNDNDGKVILPQQLWKVLVVAVYKNGRFQRYPKEGITYNMVPGEAYFVRARYMGVRLQVLEWRPEKTIYIQGRTLSAPVSLNLNRGWNGVSIRPAIAISKNTSELPVSTYRFTLAQLSKELINQGIKAKMAIFWSAVEQEWEKYELPLKAVANRFDGTIYYADRDIGADEGLFLVCEENGLYIPGPLKQIVEK